MAIHLELRRGLPQSLRLLRNDKQECEMSGQGGRGVVGVTLKWRMVSEMLATHYPLLATSALLLRKLRLDPRTQRFVEIVVGQAVEDLLEETEREQFIGGFLGDAARLEIKFLLRIDARGGRAVRATDIVGLDFEAGE